MVWTAICVLGREYSKHWFSEFWTGQVMTLNGSEVEEQDKVADDEILYRRIPRKQPPTYDRSGGSLRVLAQAFSEPAEEEGEFAGQYRLSVDRAKLCGNDPNLTRHRDPRYAPASFGVVSMPAGEVRAIPDVAEIIPDPIVNDPDLPDNPAHALICVFYSSGATDSANKKIFRNVRQELAAMANRRPWEIDPPPDFE